MGRRNIISGKKIVTLCKHSWYNPLGLAEMFTSYNLLGIVEIFYSVICTLAVSLITAPFMNKKY